MSHYAESEVDPLEETWDDWQTEDMNAMCLFCTQTFPNPEDAFAHCKQDHRFDFLTIKRSLDLDFYKCIRMINFIRTQIKENPDVYEKGCVFSGDESFWDDDSLLQPVLEDDALLHTFDELASDDEEQMTDNVQNSTTDDILLKELSQISPSTELEHRLLAMLRHTLNEKAFLQQRFANYKDMIKKTFLTINVDE